MIRAEAAIIGEMLAEADTDRVDIEFVDSSKDVPRNSDKIFLHPYMTYADMRKEVEEKHIRKVGTIHFDLFKAQFDVE